MTAVCGWPCDPWDFSGRVGKGLLGKWEGIQKILAVPRAVVQASSYTGGEEGPLWYRAGSLLLCFPQPY